MFPSRPQAFSAALVAAGPECIAALLLSRRQGTGGAFLGRQSVFLPSSWSCLQVYLVFLTVCPYPVLVLSLVHALGKGFFLSTE